MKIGKVPESVLKRSVIRQLHTKRKEVVLGAGVGEDCAALTLAPDVYKRQELKENIVLAEYTINNRTEYILREIYLKKPDVICFSCYIWNISIILEVAEEFHKLCPKVPIWVGGPEVSYEVEAFLKEMCIRDRR